MSHLEARSRWSMAARCPRQAAYALLGEEPAQPDKRTRMLWLRGKRDATIIVDALAEKHGEENVVREKPIPWPAGIGHADAFVKPERVTVEVKSHVGGTIVDDDITQLAGYIHFDPDADGKGALIVVDPVDMDVRELPVLLTDAMRDRVEGIAADVVRAGQTGVLPDRVCQRPSDGIGRFCPFIETCFADWEPPAPISLDGEVAELAAELWRADQRVRSAKGVCGEAEEARDDLRARLLEHGVEPGRDYEGAGVRVRVTRVEPAPSVDTRAAVKAGVVDEELLRPFLKPRRPYDRWDVRAVGDGPGRAVAADEFGDEVPF